MISTGIVGLQHTYVKLVARGTNVARHVFTCYPRSLNFKLQPI